MRADTKPRALAQEAKSRCGQSENIKEPRLSSLRTRGVLSEVWGRRSCFSGPLFCCPELGLSSSQAHAPARRAGPRRQLSARLVSSQESWQSGQGGLPRHSGGRLGGLYRGSEEREGPERTRVWNEHSGALSAHRICVTALPSIH